MCHQSVGLIAREIEARGIPTLSMTSAYSITRAVNPPRAAFLDYPLGHTTGKADEPQLQREILRNALAAFESLTDPGGLIELPYHWDDTDDWKTLPEGREPRDLDARTERWPEPVYQTPEDERFAEAALADGGCEGCIWLD